MKFSNYLGEARGAVEKSDGKLKNQDPKELGYDKVLKLNPSGDFIAKNGKNYILHISGFLSDKSFTIRFNEKEGKQIKGFIK